MGLLSATASRVALYFRGVIMVPIILKWRHGVKQ